MLEKLVKNLGMMQVLVIKRTAGNGIKIIEMSSLPGKFKTVVKNLRI